MPAALNLSQQVTAPAAGRHGIGSSLAARPRAPSTVRLTVWAQLPDDRDPQEAERPLNTSAEAQQYFFATDGNSPLLLQDWRAFRARLVAREQGGLAPPGLGVGPALEERWAHLIAQPERGCLLVAKQPNLGMFSNSVILMLEHNDTEGSSGLAINLPTPLIISHLGLEEGIAEAFGKAPLFIGGPVTKNLLHVLHGRREVEGSLEILDGVYAGGVESASELVAAGEAPPADFRLLAGYSGWGAGQLQEELRNGTWWVVAASPTLTLDLLRETGMWDPAASPASAPAAGDWAGPADVKLRCWEHVLNRAGVNFKALGL